MKNILIFLSVALATTFFSVDSHATTIRISDPKVMLELAPGETYSGEMICDNPTESEVKVKVYLEDWIYKPGGTGEKDFAPMATTPLSAGKWITFSPSDETIKPFGRTTIRYTVKVPEDAKGGYYAVMFFETVLGTTVNEEGANVLVAGRIGSLFFIEAKGASERKGEIKSVEFKAPEGNKPLAIVTTFQNTGNVDITVAGNFLILDADGKIVARGDVNRIYTFPGSTESIATQWVGRLAKGSYQVVLTYDLGKGQSLVEEKTLTIE